MNLVRSLKMTPGSCFLAIQICNMLFLLFAYLLLIKWMWHKLRQWCIRHGHRWFPAFPIVGECISSALESRLDLWLALTKRMWRFWHMWLPRLALKRPVSALPLSEWQDCHENPGYPPGSAMQRETEMPLGEPRWRPYRWVRQSWAILPQLDPRCPQLH